MNATKHALTYGQKDGQMSTLNGGRMIVFAWQSLLKGYYLTIDTFTRKQSYEPKKTKKNESKIMHFYIFV